METLYIGSTPYGEECAQVGSENYRERARAECNRYIREIRLLLGKEPEGARLFVKSNPHDGGSYLTVECEFEEGNEEATTYAFKCESDGPEFWTPETADVATV